MRKLIVSMNITLDGFMSGPDCELDWHFQRWTKDMADSLYMQLTNADTIVLGRKTYTAMASYWPAKTRDMCFPREDIAFADLMNNHTKLVFSKTLKTVEWNNSILVNDDVVRELSRLKKSSGKNLVIYGSGQIVQSLMKSGLVDEYQLWIHPVVLGAGKPLFPHTDQKINMKLCYTKSFSSGVIILHYKAQGE